MLVSAMPVSAKRLTSDFGGLTAGGLAASDPPSLFGPLERLLLSIDAELFRFG